jgi:hypothetical protein
MMVNSKDRKRNETVLSPVVAREEATKETNMRVVPTVLLIMAFAGGTAFAQNPPAGSNPNSSAASPDPAPVPSGPPTRPNKLSRKAEQVQPPQRRGAPASSPQGDTPPGMQPHPQGAPQQAVDPKK